jgi:hypothetical protein
MLSEADKKIQNELQQIIEKMVVDLLKERPKDIVK